MTPKPCYDPRGRRFRSQRAMCIAWGVRYDTFIQRRRRGWCVKKSLETPPSLGDECRDHHGRRYPSHAGMARSWGQRPDTVARRIGAGWTVRDALTKSTKECPHFEPVDHTGRRFSSTTEMCEAWGVKPDTWRRRLARGWTLQRSLEWMPRHRGKGAR